MKPTTLAGHLPTRRILLLSLILQLGLLLLLPDLLLLLELLHCLGPLRSALFHRRIQALQCVDIAKLIEEVISTAGRSLCAPENTCILIQGNLINAVQTLSAPLNSQR